MVSAALYVYGAIPPWAVGLIIAVATFLAILFALKFAALYRAIGPNAYFPAHEGWRYAPTVHLFQAACLLEDVEPQLNLPRKVVVWYNLSASPELPLISLDEDRLR